MANEQNLTHSLTESELRKGGQNSGKTRREKKLLRECLEILLDKEMFDKKTGATMTGAEALSAKLFAEAMKGNVRAFEVLRDTAGQKPVEKVMVAEVEQSVIDEVEKAVSEVTDGAKASD